MKKLLSFLLFFFLCGSIALASEMEEDYMDIAANYCIVGEYQLAMQYLNKILVVNPDNKQVLDLKKGLAHIIKGDKTPYVKGINPGIIQAQQYKMTGDIQNEYSSLLNSTKNENSYLAYYYLGNFYKDKGQYLKAIDAYNSALSARPNFTPAYLASAITLFYSGKYEAALNPIDKYLSIVPDDDLAYAVKSRILFQLGAMEQSKIANSKALELNTCPEYQFDRAKLLYKFGNYSEAKELFTKLLPDIQTSKIYEYLGYCDYAMEDYVSALMNIDKAIILSDDDKFLENKYNEIKELLESKQNAQTQTE